MRASWQPVLARVYGIRPWEMQDLTYRELKLITSDLNSLSAK